MTYMYIIYILGACRAYLGRAQRDDACTIVGKKEDEDIERQYNSPLKISVLV